MIWTAEDDELLRVSIESGMTAQKISELLGRTRNSVIGRAHRLDFTFKSSNAPKEQKPKKKKQVKLICEEHVSLATALIDLRYDQCKWPLDTSFCENQRRPGQSYCPEHHKMSYRPGPRS